MSTFDDKLPAWEWLRIGDAESTSASGPRSSSLADEARPRLTQKAKAGAGLATALALGAAVSPPLVKDAAPVDPDSDTESAVRLQGSDVMTVALRKASRALAMQQLFPQRDELYAAKRTFVDREYLTGLSEQESRQLAYVRWKIDLIEDAELGPSLERLESLAIINENLAATVQAIGRQVATAPKTGRRGRRRSRR